MVARSLVDDNMICGMKYRIEGRSRIKDLQEPILKDSGFRV